METLNHGILRFNDECTKEVSMAKRKLSSNTPVLKAASQTDETFRNPLHAVIRFNSACVLALDIDTEQNAVSITIEDEINNKKKTGSCSLTEV